MKIENQIENAKDTVKESFAHKFVYAISPFVGILTFIGVWFWLSQTNNANVFPSPVTVVNKVIYLCTHKLSGFTLPGHIWASLSRAFTALAFAIIIGVPFGILMGWNAKFRATFGALFECIRPIPVLAWIPLIVMWFGIGEQAKIIMIFIGALMPIVVNSYTGIKMVSPLYLDVGRMFNASSQFKLLSRIVLPAAMPTIFSGIRNSTSVALMVVLAAEMLAAKSGLGFLIVRGMEVFDIPLVMSGMIAIGLLGAALSIVTNLIEKKVCAWNRGLKSE